MITDRGVLGVDRVIRALASKNLPAEKDQVLWFLQGSSQYRVYPREGENVEAKRKWPNHRSFGVLVAFDGSQRSVTMGSGEP